MSVEDDVRKAFESHNEPVEPVVEAPAIPETEAAQTVEDRPGRTANRLRDESGRLLPGKKEEVTTPADKAAPVEAAVDPSMQIDRSIPPIVEDIPIPNALKAIFKAQWGTLTPEWRAEIARIDQAGVKGAEHLKTSARFGDEVQNVVKPYEAMIMAEGGTPARAIGDLLRTAALFRTGSAEQKQQALQQIARQYGIPLQSQIDPAQLQPGAAQPAFDPLQHPEIKQILDRQKQLDGFMQTQEQQALATNQKVVDAFLTAKDAQGSAQYPMDESMYPEFGQEIVAVKTAHPEFAPQQVLEAAYENLAWKTPEIREVRLSRLEAERDAKRKADVDKALAAKRNASGSLTGASSNSLPVAGGSIRDIVAAQVNSGGRI